MLMLMQPQYLPSQLGHLESRFQIGFQEISAKVNQPVNSIGEGMGWDRVGSTHRFRKKRT